MLPGLLLLGVAAGACGLAPLDDGDDGDAGDVPLDAATIDVNPAGVSETSRPVRVGLTTSPSPAPPRTRIIAPLPPPPPRPVAAALPESPPGLPAPPSLEPKAYTAWLGNLSRVDQRRIAAFCKRHPLDFQTPCGGIGPLHIPYPPYPRVEARTSPDPRIVIASAEAWHASLSAAQRAYIDRHCEYDESRPSSDLCGDNTPLVIVFDDQPVVFRSGVAFAFSHGREVATDWPTAATPWLALDRDGDGRISSGAELFGSGTVFGDGSTAVNGFAALAALDANHDGVIDARDPAFAKLVLWADGNGDGRGAPDELRPAAQVIESISLAARDVPRCDARGNCEHERAKISWRDAAGVRREGSVVDVYLPRR